MKMCHICEHGERPLFHVRESIERIPGEPIKLIGPVRVCSKCYDSTMIHRIKMAKVFSSSGRYTITISHLG